MRPCKNVVALFYILICATGCQSKPEQESSAHHLARIDGSIIHYYLERRKNPKRQPILLLLQGSDCNSATSIKHLSKYAELAHQAALLRIEKYGITSDLDYDSDEAREDCPKDYLTHNSIHQRVADVVDVIAALGDSESWWNRHLIIVGGSSGALVATASAALLPEAKSVVIFGYGARWFEQDLAHSLRDSPERSHVLALFKSMQTNPHRDRFVSGHSHYYWSEMLQFDQLDALRKLDMPVLALQGTEDRSVSPQGARSLLNELQLLGKKNIQHREFEGLDHSFRDATGISRLDEVLDFAREWLDENVNNK